MINRPWVVLELSTKGEKEAKEGTLSHSLSYKSRFNREDIFVPYLRVGHGDPICLMEGYVFIKTGYSSSDYWSLKEGGLIRSVLSSIDSKTGLISKGTVTDLELKRMVSKADSLGGQYKEGDRVYIKSGPFSGLEGEIVGVEAPKPKRPKEVGLLEDYSKQIVKDSLSTYAVLIELRSAEVIISLDCFSMEGA